MTAQQHDHANRKAARHEKPSRAPRHRRFAGADCRPLPAAAQPAQNIAGVYRGLMTGCLSTARSADCRKGYFELVRLAEEMDASRVVWERAAAGAPAAKGQEGYAQAKERLNRAVDDFNRDMSAPVGRGQARNRKARIEVSAGGSPPAADDGETHVRSSHGIRSGARALVPDVLCADDALRAITPGGAAELRVFQCAPYGMVMFTEIG